MTVQSLLAEIESRLKRAEFDSNELADIAEKEIPKLLAIAMRIIECYEAVLQGIAIDPLYNERVVAEAREALATAEKIAGGKDDFDRRE